MGPERARDDAPRGDSLRCSGAPVMWKLRASCMAAMIIVPAMLAPRPGAMVSQSQARYEVRIAGAEGREIDVTARFGSTPSRLRVYPNGAPGRRGWGEFIEDLQLENARGETIHVRGDGPQWDARPSSEPSVLRYRVRLRHDLERDWAAGVNEAAYGFSGGIVAIGRALFVTPESMDAAAVRFDLPSGWSVETPWARTGPDEYRVGSSNELHNAVLIAGRFHTAGDTALRVALTGEMNAGARQIQALVDRVRPEFEAIFQGPPASASVLAVVGKNRWDGAWRGGVFGTSISLLWPELPSSNNADQWAATLAHELFHLWNGATAMVTTAAEEWFKEGFATYYATVALTRAGVWDRDAAIAELGRWLGRIPDRRGAPSLIEAGAEKGRNFGLLYGGGLAVALSLDTQLRTVSAGGTSLDTVMAGLYRRRGGQAVVVTNEDLLDEIRAAGGSALADRVRGWITGNLPIPIPDTLTKLRLVATTDAGVQALRETQDGPNELLDSILGR